MTLKMLLLAEKRGVAVSGKTALIRTHGQTGQARALHRQSQGAGSG